MKLLKELTEINPNTPVFNSTKKKNTSASKLEILFEGVKDKSILSDAQAIKILYQDDFKEQNFSRLKDRLINKLIDGILISDGKSNDFSTFEKANVNCHRNWTFIKILYTMGARSTAIKIAERTISYAKKFELSDLQFLISRELRNHYSLIDFNKYKREKYHEQFVAARKLYDVETEIEEYYNEAQYQSLNSRGTINKDVLEKLNSYTTRIQELLEKYDSYRILFIGYMTFSIRHQYAYDFNAMLETCNKAASIFKSRSVTTKVAQFNFDLRRLICYIQKEEYHESDKIAKYYLDSIKSGTYNWYYMLFYYYTSFMHRGNYNEASIELQKGLSHKNFNSIADNLSQIYIVNEAYVVFLESIGEISIDIKSEKSKTNFRLYRFLNEIPIYAKDKRGLNISILIIHTLFLLQQKKYDAFIDRVDALRQYTHRYLKKDDTFRSNCFINMLISISKAEFNRIRAERYATPYIKKLNQKPIYLAEQGIEVEIIPYEKLWQLTLQLLD